MNPASHPSPAPLAITALITGANRGLGAELREAFTSRGATVLQLNRKVPDGVAAGTGWAIDLSDLGSLSKAAAHIASQLPPIDVLVNNAGVFSQDERDGLRHLSLEQVSEMVAVNAVAPTILMRALQRNIRAGGLVVNILSDMAFPSTWQGDFPLYRATKSFLWSLTANGGLSASAHFAVIGVDPGWMRTNMGGPTAPHHAKTMAEGIVGLVKRRETLQSGNVYSALTGEAIPPSQCFALPDV